MRSETNGSTSRNAKLPGVALVAAVIVLFAFGAFVMYLVAEVDVEEVKWTRLAWLFASVEAITFGAAGALFGSTIQRDRAEKAEKKAEENQESAAKGQALATVLKADDPVSDAGAQAIKTLGAGPAREAASSVAARHAALARQLFPE